MPSLSVILLASLLNKCCLCLLLHFSAEALSAVFTSDKLLLTVLISVLHPTVEKIAGVDSHSPDALETSTHCSGATKQYFSKAGRNLWRQKSATMPAKQKCVSCDVRRLSEPLIQSVERNQLSQTSPDTNTSHINRTQNYSSAVIENLRFDGALAKPSSSSSNTASVSNRVASQGCEVTTTCAEEPLVVNPVYRSDDCSTLKSLSFEKKGSCSLERTFAPDHLHTLNGSVSNQHTSSSSAQEEKCCTTVNITPVSSCSVTEENLTFLDVPSSSDGVTTSSYGSTDVPCAVSETDNEANDVCSRLGYRKVCVYLQEGTWRHSPHSLHCIRVDDDISLIVLCEVMLL